MKSTTKTHRQSKRYTIMLIPESTAKIKKMRVRPLAFGVLGIPLLCVLLITVLFQIRMTELENTLDNSAVSLNQTISEQSRLRESLSSALSSQDNSRTQYETAVSQIDDYEREIGEYEREIADLERQIADNEQKLVEMLARIETIESMRQSIVSALNDLASLDIPFQFDVSTLSNATRQVMGGADITEPESILAELDDMLAELDAITLSEAQNMRALAEITGDLESYFKARPTGWPIIGGRVGSEFGYRMNDLSGRGWSKHNGIDIGTPSKTEVFATAYGVVSFAGWNSGGYGYLVIIDHDYGYKTYYAHNSKVLVEVGDEVSRGQLIALSGSTGRSATPHVHYEVRVNDIPQNPRGYLS